MDRHRHARFGWFIKKAFPKHWILDPHLGTEGNMAVTWAK